MKPHFVPSTLLFTALATFANAEDAPSFRPPAVPLVVNDPYLSIWSCADHLTDDVTRHWTSEPNPLISLIRIDGAPYRLMGNDPGSVTAMSQTGLQITPTRSIYEFDDTHVHVTMTFMTPVLPSDMDVLTRPLTYITWAVKSVDGKPHAVSIYDSTSSALAVSKSTNAVTWQREAAGPLTALKAGADLQTIFDPRGDHVRINWGYAYAAASASQSQSSIGSSDALIKGFLSGGTLPTTDDAPPRSAKENEPAMAFVFDLGSVNGDVVSRHLMVAYDELYEVKFSNEKLLPYWKRNGATMADLLQTAETDYPSLVQKCQTFDKDLTDDMTKVGGPQYSQICALAYRQCLAGTGIAADANKQPLLFTKENTSNGDIATVDVIFPMNPLLLVVSPALAKASIAPVMVYAASDRWKFPNAPHDLGLYPVASATGAAGEAMVVEESGNMIILCDAIAKADGNPSFCTPWWPQLTQWANYLQQYGLDPGNQLCTDDFMGHLAHNSNLSVKAIVALAAYGDLCKRRGDTVTAQKFSDLAKADAQNWMKMSTDGDHARLAFDKPGTWSQLYNLVWDHLLGLDTFPPSVAQEEITYYKTQMQPYGLPLDSRKHISKIDWTFWTATLSSDPNTFSSFVTPIYNYLNKTPARLPLVDSYMTDAVKSSGMYARPVVGGLFIKLMSDDAIWKKWADQGNTPVGPWAPIHPLPVLTALIPAEHKSIIWHYTTEKPRDDWTSTSFDDSKWLQGKANAWKPKDSNNDSEAPKENPKVTDVWMRTQITLPNPIPPSFVWILRGRSDGELYLNGIRAGTASEHGNPEPQEIYAPAQSLLKPGAQLTVSAHLLNRVVVLVDIALGTATAQ